MRHKNFQLAQFAAKSLCFAVLTLALFSFVGRSRSTAEEPAAAPLVTGKPAQFVRIELPGDKRILTLAEVEISSGGKNVARSGKATQSSTNGDAVAARAIDGNKDRDFGNNGQ